MDLEYQIPILIFHILEADISEDSSIIDEDVYPAKVLNGGLNDCFSILHAVIISDRLSACGFDLVDNNIGGLGSTITSQSSNKIADE